MASSTPLVELCSWKEIAAYLGVSVKTAQVWEATRGLPVRRLPGPRVQVRALVAELEAWKATDPRPTPAAPEPVDALPVSAVGLARSNRWFRASHALAVFVIVVGGVALGLSVAGRPVLASVSVVQDALVGFDAAGVPLWRHDFGSLRPNAYGEGERRSWVGILGGERVVLFTPVPAGLTKDAVPIVCLDAKGRERWRFTPGKPLRRGNDVFAPPFVARQFAVINERIIVTSHHHLYYPSQVAVLNADGNLLREYYHPGHLNVLTTGTYQGRSVAFLGGVNNAAHAATLVVLDPDRLDGAASIAGTPAFTGLPNGVSAARLLFPRSCLSANDPYNAVVNIITAPDGVIVDVHDEINATNPASIQYHLNADLALQDASVSDVFQSKHSRAGHAFTTNEQAALRTITRLE